MAISGTPWPIRFTAAEPARSKYFLPVLSHTYTPSPRTAEGNFLRKDRWNTDERICTAFTGVTDELSQSRGDRPRGTWRWSTFRAISCLAASLALITLAWEDAVQSTRAFEIPIRLTFNRIGSR